MSRVDDLFFVLWFVVTLCLLTERRNCLGENQFFVGKHHKGYDFLRGLASETSSGEELQMYQMEPSYFDGISGTVLVSDKCVGAGE